MSLANHRAMGVINLTPDSFSDGGNFYSKNTFVERFNSLTNCEIIDLGAESTAPFNNKITLNSELERFEKLFFDNYKSLNIKDSLTLSIDTYKYETFKKVYSFLKKSNFKGQIIWNDVSGVYKDGLFSFLHNEVPSAKYIYSHTTTINRQGSAKHLDKLFDFCEDTVVQEVTSYFDEFLKSALESSLSDRMILDPCFGFSKSKLQNFLIINAIDKIFPDIDKTPVLLGVSRKSFLKSHIVKEPETKVIEDLDILTSQVTNIFIKKFTKRQIVHRLHNTHVLFLAKNISTVLD